MIGLARRPLALAGIAVALITLFFAGWVALELYLGPSLSTDGQFRLHIVRGVTTSILVALFVLYWSERRVRQAEEIVKHRELHLARVLKESVDAIVGIDRHGNVVYWNRGAELLYGYHPAEILGQSFQKLVPNGIRSTKAATPALLARGEHIQEFLTERMTKSGEAVSVMVTQTALGKEVRECTGCRALEQGLSDVRKLEHQVIHTEQLATVGEMAAGLAHEIKNPLAGIAGAIQVLGDTLPEGDERGPVVHQVLGQVKRIEGTLRDLLTYARPKTAKLEPTDLHDIIEQSLGVIALFPKKRIAVVRNFQDSLPRAMVDAELFSQVLTNLFINAAQAMGNEGTLTITTSTGPQGIQLSVQDTGTGIRESKLKRIFDPFYTTKTRGTGLGLPICRRVVETHNGTISVDSKYGHGAEFIISLPFQPRVEQPDSAKELPLS